MKFKLKNLSPLIGILILIYILYIIDLRKLFLILSSASPFLIIIAAAISLFSMFIINLRWLKIIKIMDMNISYRETLSILAKGITLGTITPGKLGELYRSKYLKDKTKKSFGVCFSSVILCRLFDLFSLLVLGCLAILFFTYYYSVSIISPLFLIILILIFSTSLFIFSNHKRMKSVLKPIVSSFIPENHKSKLRFHFNEFYKGLYSIKIKNYLILLSYTLIMWCINIFTVYLLSQSLNIQVSFFYYFLIFPIILLINLIPISISGLGTSQASFMFFLFLKNIPAESAVALSFLVIFITGMIYALPGLVLYLIKK